MDGYPRKSLLNKGSLRVIVTEFLHPVIEFMVAQPILIAKSLFANTFGAPLIVKLAHLFYVCFHDTRLANFGKQEKMGLVGWIR